MGKIHILPEHVANKIAAGEVVERPASVVKELLENALDAGATRIKINVEAGGKKLIQITDNGCGMVRDDAMLAFERHATSKIKDAEDLLSVATLGFRGEALPSIASVSRLHLETCAAFEVPRLAKEARRGAPPEVDEEFPPKPKDGLGGVPSVVSDAQSGTIIEINGGKMARVEEAGLPVGTSITVRDLFFNTPARKKFLKSESTELSHIASLVTHYALAHPEKHFELHSLANAILVAPPVAGYSERVYQVFGKETLDQLIPVAASQTLEHVGLPQLPPWRRQDADDEDEDGGRGVRPTSGSTPGEIRVHGFVSKPEIQKLNRNSIFVFVNGRLIRDRLVQHALTEAYRNIIPPTVYPVVLLFLELPAGEVDVNVHPSKTEVRFRQQTVMHDFVRDSVRAALMKARPVPQFTTEIRAHATASSSLTPGAMDWVISSGVASAAGVAAGRGFQESAVSGGFALPPPSPPPISTRFQFEEGIAVEANAAIPVARGLETASIAIPDNGCAPALEVREEEPTLDSLGTLKPLGQIRNSFILAVNEDGLWIIDQHVAHERVLFERVLKQRAAQRVECQRLLMPIVVELSPAQQAVFAEIADELQRNGFEAEAFGGRSVAVKVAPAGVDAAAVEHMLQELLDQISREEQSLNLEKIRTRIAASIACHAAIKVNMPLETNKMEWLLAELANTDHPMSCPHGRPVVLRYSVKEIQKAFKRI
jgi:DNA mismatch repair protein MutL